MTRPSAEVVAQILKYLQYPQGLTADMKYIAAALDQFRNEGIEEAAKIVDDHSSGRRLCAEGVAERIRSLKRPAK